MATYYDVSMPIRDGMLSWPSDPGVSLKPFKSADDKGSNVAKLESGTHLGTHIDAPKHFSNAGIGVDALPAEQLIGPAVVVDLTNLHGDTIAPHDFIDTLPEDVQRVLFKTRNSVDGLLELPYTEDYVGLSGEAAEWLAENGVRVVGIDYLSIQKRGPDRTPHTALLDRNIAIIEGLDLATVPAGEYELIALPLRIEEGDGAPARVLLKQP